MFSESFLRIIDKRLFILDS